LSGWKDRAGQTLRLLAKVSRDRRTRLGEVRLVEDLAESHALARD